MSVLERDVSLGGDQVSSESKLRSSKTKLNDTQNNQNSADEFHPAAYCYISDQKVHFTPIEDDSDEEDNNRVSETFQNTPLLKYDADYLPDKLYLKNKNLLYSLNNPSISDVETDTNTNSTTVSHSNGHNLSTPSAEVNTSAQSQSQSQPSPTSRSPSPNPSGNASVKRRSLYFPKYVINLSENLETDFVQLKRLIVRAFPEWADTGKLEIKQVTGGITNMLLSCTYSNEKTILIRVYGHGTNLIIDRHREFISHLILNSIGLAPTVFARFKNGLMYGYLSGRSLKPEELSNEKIYPLIAQQLGNWHKSLNYKLIEEGVDKIRALRIGARRNSVSKKKSAKKKRFISNIWELIDEWIEIVPVNPELIASFQQHLHEDVNEGNLKEVVKKEFHWLKNILEAVKSPIVSSHCDLLSGNVIIPEDFESNFYTGQSLPSVEQNPIKFIDYEYMLPAPRAFDIANHLAEWQGFNCDRSAIPEPTNSNPVIVKWCESYLDNRQSNPTEVESLINEVSMFYGLPGFYWGIWAMIQSELSNIDFDYADYGKLRLEEYWDWKAKNQEKIELLSLKV
ncbi:hypothetical protein CANMA_004291 [Candida margitis]|uniref:uncharacterized protein n=1 Tax=Candida margitis TaxID=1775924 RepID=UPI002226D4BD|nr:uncharacterized protein CANMA_004291 [Candida margitis]KAI5958137.1 hypothetical protein CANMA_004291 [Candida margitis]